jgi:hypothetical protein
LKLAHSSAFIPPGAVEEGQQRPRVVCDDAVNAQVYHAPYPFNVVDRPRVDRELTAPGFGFRPEPAAVG